LACRVSTELRIERRERTIDLALAQLRRPDRLVRRCDLLGDDAECAAPVGDRTRLAFVAEPERCLVGEALRKFLSRDLGRDPVLKRPALVLERLDALLDLGRGCGPCRARCARIDGADSDAGRSFTLDAQ